MRRAAPALALTLLTAWGVVGCSGSSTPQQSTACAALEKTVEDAQREAEVAIGTITTDPAAAGDLVTTLRETVAAALDAAPADQRDYLTRAGSALDQLDRQVRRSAKGKVVEGTVIGDVRTELLDVVQDVRADC
jgi:hypothetical protein